MTVRQVKAILTLLNEDKDMRVEVKTESGDFIELSIHGVRMDKGEPVILTY